MKANLERIALNILLSFICVNANTQIINTIAGTPGIPGYSGDGGPALQAKLNAPDGMTFDNSGNIYFFDELNAVIRKIDNSGNITTIAGNGTVGYSGDGGPAIAAQLSNHYSGHPAFDNAGNLYFADAGNNVIRKINTAGIITTIAGNGSVGYSGDGGPALNAQLYNPRDIAIDNNGNIYIADGQLWLRKINSNGIITRVAGTGFFGPGIEGVPATQSPISTLAVDVDNNGNIYICDTYSSLIREINSAGIISTIAGTGVAGYSGDGGPATSARLNNPYDVQIDATGNIYISDYDNYVIRKIDASGIIATIAGNGTPGYSGDGGPAILAQINQSPHVSVDNQGNVYITDFWFNHVIRKISLCTSSTVSSVNITASSPEVCQKSPLTFIAASVNGGTSPFYQWKINSINTGSNAATLTTSSLSDGDVVSCIMTSSINCTSPVTSNSITVTVLPSPSVSAGQDVLISPGASTQLNATATGNIISYQWTPASGLSSTTILNPVATPNITTTYQLDAISDKGCKGSGKITVTVYKRLQMPSAFTPNNDGKNDLFRIPSGTTLNLKSFSVYDRSGNVVFKTDNINKGWDGTYKSVPASTGVYVYLITGTDPKRTVLEKGTIMLVR